MVFSYKFAMFFKLKMIVFVPVILGRFFILSKSFLFLIHQIANFYTVASVKLA